MTTEPAASLTPEQFNRACDLFGQAVAEGVPTDEREAFLEQHAAQDDAAVREHVLSMLAFHHKDAHKGETATFEYLASDAIRQETVGWTSKPFAEMPERIGSFRIIRHIATGGMGAVFEAEQEKPKRRVALKLIRTDMLGPQTVQRFEREATVLARLTHPGIARVYAMGRADTPTGVVPYIVMEYVEGEVITDYARKKRLAPRAILELLMDICGAVHYAHRRGVIHRDLKPNNILVDAEGRPRVLDFGIARALDDDISGVGQITGTGVLMGTLNYMSPEMVKAEDDALHVRVDVYALAAVGFELLTGKPPADFSELTPLEALAHMSDGDSARLDTFDKRYRGDLTVIFEKALATSPEDRYGGMAEFGEDMRRLLHKEPITARPFSRGYYLRRFIGRHKALVGAGVIAFLSLAGGLIYALLAQNREADARRAAERHASRSADLQHAASLKVISQSLRSGQRNTAFNTFERLEASADDWEYRFLDAHLHDAIEIHPWPDGAVLDHGHVFTEQFIVSRGEDRDALRFLDTVSGAVADVRCPPGEPPIKGVHVSADGRSLVVAFGDSRWGVLDIATRTWWHVLTADTPFAEHASGARSLHLVGHKQKMKLFDIERGVQLQPAFWSGPGNYRTSWAVDGEGRVIWASRAGDILIARPTSSVPEMRLQMASAKPSELYVDAGGRWLASRRSAVEFWNLSEGALQWRMPRLGGDVPSDVAFDPESDRAAVSYTGGTVQLVDVRRREVLTSMFDGRIRTSQQTYGAAKRAVRFGSGPDRVVTWSRVGRARWHARPDAVVPRVLQHFKREAEFPFVYVAAFHPGGRFLASGAWDGRVVIWDTWTGREVVRHVLREDDVTPRRVFQVAWSDDGTRLLVHGVGGDYTILDPWTGTEHVAGTSAGQPIQFAAGSNEDALVRYGNEIRRVRLEGSESRPSKRPAAAARGALPAWIWAAEQDYGFREFRVVGDRAVAIGRWLWGRGADHSFAVWKRGEPDSLRVHTLDSEVLGLTPSSDRRRLFLALRSGTVVVWDMERELPALELSEHDGYVIGVAVSPLDGTLATSSEDGTVRLWHTVRLADRLARAKSARERTARLAPVVKTLLEEHGSREAAAAALRADPGLSPEDRTAALAVLAAQAP